MISAFFTSIGSSLAFLLENYDKTMINTEHVFCNNS